MSYAQPSHAIYFLAPDGCLQYFTAQRGTVQSFNFNVNKHQLNDQDYSVCIRNNPGMKKITVISDENWQEAI
jgi:hypothetical protein